MSNCKGLSDSAFQTHPPREAKFRRNGLVGPEQCETRQRGHLTRQVVAGKLSRTFRHYFCATRIASMLDVLVVAPHPDDAELGMAGAIMKFKDDGWRVGILDLTNG